MADTALNSAGVLARYDYLWRLPPDRWAWEFLRRNPGFRRDAACAGADLVSERAAPCPDIRLLRPRAPQTLAERWGLVFMPDPERNGFKADAVWSPSAFPDQVEVSCSPRAPDQACEIWDRTVPICQITHITDFVGREFLLVRRNGYVVQLRCTGLSLLGLEPVRMKFTMPGVENYERRIKYQKAAFEVYGEQPDLSRPQWSKTTQVLRDGLIALDGLERGLSRRDIAVILYGADRVDADWSGPSLRHTLRYLVKKAEALRDGGYLSELLGADLWRAQAESV